MKILIIVACGLLYVAGLVLFLVACGVKRARAERVTSSGQAWDQQDWKDFAFAATIFQFWIVLGPFWAIGSAMEWIVVTIGERVSRKQRLRAESAEAARIRIEELESQLRELRGEPPSYREVNRG